MQLGGFVVGNGWVSPKWGGFQTDGNEFNLTGAPTIVLNTPTTFVVRLDQTTNIATIYFNPDLNVAENLQPAGSVTNYTITGALDAFNNIMLRAGVATGSTTFSNISIYDSSPFAAVPEPSASLIASVGGLQLCLRRRKR